MRVVACTCVTACCLGLAGCSLFGKKDQAKSNQPAPALAGNGWGTPGAAGPIATDQTVSRGSGILAGRVLDSYDHRPPPTFIQVVAAQDGNGARGAPIEVAADEQGFFTIHGLQPGQPYELIARTRDGSPKLAGRVWTKAPNPRVLIWMSSDFATQNVPPAPGPPIVPGQKPSPTNALPGAAGQDPSGAPADGSGGRGGVGDPNADPASSSRPGGSSRGVDILPPVRLGDSPPHPGSSSGPGNSSQPHSEIRPQDIVGIPGAYAQGSVPANIPGLRPLEPQVPSAPVESTVPNLAVRAPSCVLTGRQLDNFALYDINGKVWEYRNHRGRLVLLDFWGTWCLPCQSAIPHLRVLQDNYGPSGLEVIGIAYERGGTFQDQARTVQSVRDRKRINYRLLLGADSEAVACPVRTQFGVDGFPTLVLLDANNRIIWKEKGLLDEYKLRDLQVLIESQLRARQ